MKVTELINIDSKYNFEAPLLSAKTRQKLKESKLSEKELLDLNSILLQNPKDTFIVRVGGDSMIDKNIFDGDLLIVDSKRNAISGDVVIASMNNEMTVKTFKLMDGKAYLIAANERFLPMEISEFYQFQIHGVVRHVVRNL